MIGRTITTRQTVVACVRAIALLGFGWMADRLGVRAAILMMAGISALGTALAALRSPALWRYRSPSDSQPSSEFGERASEVGHRTIGRLLFNNMKPMEDPQFAPEEQRRVNNLVLIMLGAGWAIFLLVDWVHALAVLGAVGATLCVASLARRVLRHLRSAHRERAKASVS